MRKTIHSAGEGMMLACTVANHRYTYERLMALNPRKQKLQFNEKQPANAIQQSFWIYPEVLAALHERWPGNMMTTMCSLFSALADGSSFLVEGEYARELAQAKPPITKGREIAGLLHTIDQMKAQILGLEEQVKARRAASPAVDPSALNAILQALTNSGIKVDLPSNVGQAATSGGLDYVEGDPDFNAEPPTLTEDDIPGVRIPISNYRG